MAAKDGVEISGLAHPDILLTGIARHIGKSVLAEHVINETGAIHAAVRGIGRSVAVTKILFCQRESGVDDLAYLRRIAVVICYFFRRKTNVWRAFLSARTTLSGGRRGRFR